MRRSSRSFYALDVGRGVATDALTALAVTCGFTVRVAILPDSLPADSARIQCTSVDHKSLTCMLAVRQPRRPRQ